MYQGIFRFLLAFIVIVFHIFSTGPMPGRIAVFSFYLLSGYLITRVINEKYTGTNGTRNFLINRFLRLYPAYAIVLLISSIYVYHLHTLNPTPTWLAFPEDADMWPQNLGEWARQIFIFGLVKFEGDLYDPRIVPVSFSLSIEIMHYAAMSLFLVRNKIIFYTWLLIGIVLAIWYSIQNDFTNAYLSYWGPTVMFSLGGLAYYSRNILNKLLGVEKFAVQGALLSVCVYLAYIYSPLVLAGIDFIGGKSLEEAKALHSGVSVSMLYLSAPIVITILTYSLNVKFKPNSGWWRGKKFEKLNTLLASISYPFFLSHLFFFGTITLFFHELSQPIRFVMTVFASFLFSWALVRFVEHPIEKIRGHLRSSVKSVRKDEPL